MERFRNRTICGDWLEIMREMPNECVHLIIADPPYGSGGRDGSVHLLDSNIAGNRMSAESHVWFLRECAKGLFRITVPEAHCYVFSDWRKYMNVKIAFETVGWECRSLLVWDKGNGMGEYWRSSHEFILWFTKRKPRKLTHGGCFNVLRYAPVRGKDKKHPAQKPKELIAFLIKASSNEGDVVLDPFVGTGTTCIAAKELGRDYIGIDTEQEYVEIADCRLGAAAPFFDVNQRPRG